MQLPIPDRTVARSSSYGWKQVVILSVFGGLLGLMAVWRRSLVPGMAVHAWADIYSGWLNQ